MFVEKALNDVNVVTFIWNADNADLTDGRRFNPAQIREISNICIHPDFRKRSSEQGN